MNVKISIDIDESYRAFAEQKVKDGEYPSISSVVEAGIEQMMIDANNDSSDVSAGMADEIRSRLDLPRDQWIAWDGDEMFKEIYDMIDNQTKAQKP